MSTDRISRLQSLLDRIKKNAALPKRSLGSNLFVGGTPQPQSDVATGPAVPASSINRAQPAAPDTDVARPHRPPLPPIATAEAAMHQPAPAAPQRTPTLSGAARVPTMSGGAIVPPKPPVAEARPPAPSDVIEELDFDDAEVVDITSDRPPPAEISSVEVSQVVSVDEPAEASSKEPAADDLDDLHWTEPPTQDQRPPDSSPRPRAATSLDEALSGVTAESEPDIPLKTPPPESGRQPLEGVYAPSIPATTTTDLLPMPTAEQLGETVDLGAPTVAALELDLATANLQKAREDLEFELPPRPSILEPPTTRDEMPTLTLETGQRAPQRSQFLNVPDDGDTIETAAITTQQEAAEPSTDRDNPVLSPELTTRPARTQVVNPEFIYAARRFAPRSFAELLDASLKLSG